MAWSDKYAGELQSEEKPSDRGERQAKAYIPIFYTSGWNKVGQQAMAR